MRVFSDVIPDVNSLFWVVSSFLFYLSFVQKGKGGGERGEKKQKPCRADIRKQNYWEKTTHYIQWSFCIFVRRKTLECLEVLSQTFVALLIANNRPGNIFLPCPIFSLSLKNLLGNKKQDWKDWKDFQSLSAGILTKTRIIFKLYFLDGK